MRHFDDSFEKTILQQKLYFLQINDSPKWAPVDEVAVIEAC